MTKPGASRRGAFVTAMFVAALLLASASSAATPSDPRTPTNALAGTLTMLGTLPPFVFFSVMAVVCVLPVPASLFYVFGAAAYGPATALAWASLGIAGNVWLGQTLSARALRPLAMRLLARRNATIPSLRGGRDDALVIALVRITPGVPLFVQNCVLGLANADLPLSLAISTPIQLAYATGFALFGQAAFHGRLGGTLLGLALIASVSLVARLLHRRLSAHASAAPIGAKPTDTSSPRD